MDTAPQADTPVRAARTTDLEGAPLQGALERASRELKRLDEYVAELAERLEPVLSQGDDPAETGVRGEVHPGTSMAVRSVEELEEAAARTGERVRAVLRRLEV